MAETLRMTTYARYPPCVNVLHLNKRRHESGSKCDHEPENPDCLCSSIEEGKKIEESTQLLKTSYNFVDYVRARETDSKEFHKINQEQSLRYILTHELYRHYAFNMYSIDKVFCSQWLNDTRVVFGTKCNRLMVINVTSQKLDYIPLLHGRHANLPHPQNREQHCGIHSIKMNPSRTLMATGARYSNEIAVYRLPTLEPVCVGEKGHTNWIFDLCWLDDEFLVSGSRDSNMCLWRIDNELAESRRRTDVSCAFIHNGYGLLEPHCIKKCRNAIKIRALAFNKVYREIAALSSNNFLHIWSAEMFRRKISTKLSAYKETTSCIAVQDDGVYAVGCLSRALLLDARNLKLIKKVPLQPKESKIRSLSFQGSILTMGTNVGTIMFYDVRAQKYLESSVHPNRTIILRTPIKYMLPADEYVMVQNYIKYKPTIFTHCYDASGTRIFSAGGPILDNMYGNYMALLQ